MVERINENDNASKAQHPGLTIEDAFGNPGDNKIPQTPAAQSDSQLQNSTKFSITDREMPGNDSPRAIVDKAVANVGQKVWESNEKGNITQNGRLSAAVSVSEILKQGGVEGVNEASVRGLYNSLVNKGWIDLPVDQAQPGDVVLGLDGRPVSNDLPVFSTDPVTGEMTVQGTEPPRTSYSGDAGIVGEDGKIYASLTSRGGIWSVAGNGRFSPENPRWQTTAGEPKLHVLRAPQTCNE